MPEASPRQENPFLEVRLTDLLRRLEQFAHQPAEKLVFFDISELEKEVTALVSQENIFDQPHLFSLATKIDTAYLKLKEKIKISKHADALNVLALVLNNLDRLLDRSITPQTINDLAGINSFLREDAKKFPLDKQISTLLSKIQERKTELEQRLKTEEERARKDNGLRNADSRLKEEYIPGRQPSQQTITGGDLRQPQTSRPFRARVPVVDLSNSPAQNQKENSPLPPAGFDSLRSLENPTVSIQPPYEQF